MQAQGYPHFTNRLPAYTTSMSGYSFYLQTSPLGSTREDTSNRCVETLRRRYPELFYEVVSLVDRGEVPDKITEQLKQRAGTAFNIEMIQVSAVYLTRLHEEHLRNNA
jgi:hypothetical protein